MAKAPDQDGILQISTFYVGPNLCGMDIDMVQEINKLSAFTRVPLAPDYVRGVMNLRGRIITIIDLGFKLGLEPTVFSEDTQNITVESKGEFLGLLVDRIWDVITIRASEMTAPPANMGGLQGKYFKSVVPLDNTLVGVIDIRKVLAEDADRE